MKQITLSEEDFSLITETLEMDVNSSFIDKSLRRDIQGSLNRLIWNSREVSEEIQLEIPEVESTTFVHNSKFEIRWINHEEALSIIEKRTPFGLFLEVDHKNGKVIAIDNSNGDAWTEEFLGPEDAISWLKGTFELEYLK